ncbi:PepSY-associated TM helix domain-containing protein, partial [Xanthomonas phaseoli]
QARLPESVVPAQRAGAAEQHAHGEQAPALQVADDHVEHSGHGAPSANAAHAGNEDHAGHLAQSQHAARHAHSADNAHADHGDSAGFAAPGRGAIGLDAAMARFQARGIQPGYSVAPPRGATGVYTASVYPADLQRQRVIHLDQYSGAVLLDMRYRDYGPLAKLLEWGINVHLGQQYGTANQLILLLACIAIVLLCVSAAVMWWKRRPSGGLGVPPLPADPRTLRGLMALLVLCGLIFPLVGLSLVLMWAFDRYWMRRAHADALAG